MPISVNDADDTDHVRIQLVIHGIGIAGQECAPQQSVDDKMLLRRIGDVQECVIDGVQKAFSGRRRTLAIPCKGRLDLFPCWRANAQGEHLAELSEQGAMNVRPRIAGLWRAVRLKFVPVELGREVDRYRCGACRVETIPQMAHQRYPLLGGECVDGKWTGSHGRNYASGPV